MKQDLCKGSEPWKSMVFMKREEVDMEVQGGWEMGQLIRGFQAKMKGVKIWSWVLTKLEAGFHVPWDFQDFLKNKTS